MDCYELEVKAKHREDSGEEAEELRREIVEHIISIYYHEVLEGDLIQLNRFRSTVFHRLYINLVDKEESIEGNVEELRKRYSLQGVKFHLRKQHC
jgi:hypothetical protein